jgi:hypothetical protein
MPKVKRSRGYESDESGEEDSETFEEEEGAEDIAEDMTFSSDDDKPLEDRANESKSADEEDGVDEDAEVEADIDIDEVDEMEAEPEPRTQVQSRSKRSGKGQQPRLKITLKIPPKLQSGSNSTEGTATPPLTRPTRARGSRGGRGGRRPAPKKRVSSHGLHILLLIRVLV